MNNERPSILRRFYRGTLRFFSESCYWVSKATRDTDPQGSFLLPKHLTPFFYPAICISIVTTAAIALALEPPDPATQAATTQGALTLKQFIYKAVTLNPTILGSATAGALLITPLLYFATGGVSMLANYLKRKEEEARNPETVVQLKEARKVIEEKDKVIAERDESIARLEQQNQELKDQLGLNGDDC